MEVYFLSWAFLVAGAVGVDKLKLGGTYLVTVWNFSAWLAAVIALVEAMLRARWAVAHGSKPDLDIGHEEEHSEGDSTAGRRFVRGIVYQPPVQHVESQETPDETEPVETEPTEITPLMRQHRRRSAGGREYVIGVDGEPVRIEDSERGVVRDEYGWWILQMIALIPLPTILFTQILVVLAHALRNTLADGSSPITGESGSQIPLSHSNDYYSVRRFCYAQHLNSGQHSSLCPPNQQNILLVDPCNLCHHSHLRFNGVPIHAGGSFEIILPTERRSRCRQYFVCYSG